LAAVKEVKRQMWDNCKMYHNKVLKDLFCSECVRTINIIDSVFGDDGDHFREATKKVQKEGK
jgi:hypothetical protein